MIRWGWRFGDTDDDNDGVADAEDVLPFDATEDTDTDSDGVGNNADLDDDNDGLSDEVEADDRSTKASTPSHLGDRG